MIYSNLDYNNHDPSIEHIHQNFNTFFNTKIFLSGSVVDINDSKYEISIQAPEGSWLIKVKIPNSEELPEKGDIIEIYGILDGEDHVTAEKIMVIKQWEYNLIIIRSLPAIPFTLYLFFKTWRFNRRKYWFERRNKDA